MSMLLPAAIDFQSDTRKIDERRPPWVAPIPHDLFSCPTVLISCRSRLLSRAIDARQSPLVLTCPVAIPVATMTTKRPRRTQTELSPDEAAKLRDSALSTIMAQDEAEALQSYLNRGRRFQSTDTESLKDQWTVAARRFFLSFGAECSEDMSDAAAELSLRQVNPPMDLVENELAVARQQIERDKDDPEIHARIEARIRELRERQDKFH